MRDVVLKIVIAAMLFVTVEGTAEAIDETSFHQTHHAHTEDGTEWFPDSDGSDHEGDACEHFCHTHVVALTPQVSLPVLPKSRSLLQVLPVNAAGRAPASPIPPPNI